MTLPAQMKAVRIHFQRGSNILRKLFRSKSYKMATKVEGHCLNSNALTRSFIAGRKARDNDDRYLWQVRKPTTRCAFSFAIDFSGSMSSSPTQSKDVLLDERADTWTRVLGAIHALSNVADSVGIQSKIGFVQFERDYENDSKFQSVILKDWHDKSWTDDMATSLTTLSPNSGTCCADYARASIKMLENIKSEYKVAFFLTDGEDSWSRDYYKSLNSLAESLGIKLVGIAFSNDSSLKNVLPNGCVVRDTKQLGEVIFRHLEGLF